MSTEVHAGTGQHEAAALQQLAHRCRHALYSIRTGLALMQERQQDRAVSPEIFGMLDRESRQLAACVEHLIRQAQQNRGRVD